MFDLLSGGALAAGMGLAAWLAGEIFIKMEIIPDILEPQLYGFAAIALGMAPGVAFGAPARAAAPSDPDLPSMSTA